MNKWFFIGAVVLLGFVITQYRPHQNLINELYKLPTNCEKAELRIKFLGNTNILLYDDENAVLTDGFFSRPSLIRTGLLKVKPNLKRIKKSLETAGIKKIDAVIPVHSHYDHAMDVAEVTKLAGSKLFGSKSTLMIGEGGGLKPSQMQEVHNEEEIRIGEFKIRFINSLHWPYPGENRQKKLLNNSIQSPIVPPASIYDYKEGTSYTLLIEYEEIKIAIHGSAGYVKDALPSFNADILFLSVAGIETMTESYNSEYQKHIIEALNPDFIIPIHWDDIFSPLGKNLKPFKLPVIMGEGLNLKKAINIIKTNNPNREIVMLKLWESYCSEELINSDNGNFKSSFIGNSFNN